MLQPINWSPGVSLENVEKQVILKAFRFYRGNKTQCAISLGINVRTLENKLQRYEENDKTIEAQENQDRINRAQILDRMRGNTPDAIYQNGGQSLYRPDPGVHMESTIKNTTQQPVPVPEPKEVQSVLPKHSAKSGQRR